jgi:hypothetical protein
MLYARAASDVCRQVAPDSLAGIAYTVEEMELDAPVATVRVSRAKPQPAPIPEPDLEHIEATPVTPEPDVEPPVEDVAEPKLTARQRGKMFALFEQKGIDESEQLSGIAHIVGRPVAHRDALTADEFDRVIAALESRPDVIEARGAALKDAEVQS